MKKLVGKITSNALVFVLGALVFGGIIGGVAATAISANDIAYTTSKNSSVATVKDAVDDLYFIASKYPALLDYSKVTGSGITYKYSQDDASAYNMELSGASSTNSGYSNGDFYLRTTYVNGNATGHAACIKYNDREFCIEPNYWACPLNTWSEECALKTKAKLQAAMEAALGVSADSCSSGMSNAQCYFGSAVCAADYTGYVQCSNGSEYYAKVESYGTARYNTIGSGGGGAA